MAEEQEAQEQQKGGNKMMLFVIIGAVLVLIIVGVVVIMLMSGGDEEEQSKESAPVKQEQAKTKKTGSVGSDPTLMNVGPILVVTGKEGPLIVNLSTQGRNAYVSIYLSIALSNEKVHVEAERKMDIIKHTFIDVLSTKTPEEMKTVKGRQRALEEARNRINEFMLDGEVTHVFHSNVFVQQG